METLNGLKLERISDTLSVYQQKGVFSYGTDAVILANFVKGEIAKSSPKLMCDLCSGTGIIPFMLCDYFPELVAHAVEINTTACKLAEKSSHYNNFSSRYIQYNANLKEYKTLFNAEQFDFLTCNPPYMTNNCGKMCLENYKTIARHEIHCTIDDIFKAARYLLRTGGNIYIVYRSERMASLFSAAQNNRFHIKKLTAVISKNTPSNVKLFVCKAQKDASEGLILNADTVENLCQNKFVGE